MHFSTESLFDLLKGLPSPRRYWVAYSGGCDSQVLLHAMSTLSGRLAAPVHAIHINHGLQSAAPKWAAHCEQVCQSLSIPLVVMELGLSPVKGESLEALARKGRYQAFTEQMERGDMLLTAHHQDDQAETVLIQLLRGAGPAGLGAMAQFDHFAEGYRCRPLLQYTRDQLADYAQAHQLHWVEDDSNGDLSFDRNYLRKEILPRLQIRWPGVARTLSRSATHCAESHKLIEIQAEEDLKIVSGAVAGTLDTDRLLQLSLPRLRALLRLWITSSGFTLPNTARLNGIISEVIRAHRECSPHLKWSGAEVRRYRNTLYLMSPLEALDAEKVVSVVPDRHWQLPTPGGDYRLTEGEGGIDPEMLAGRHLEICFHPHEKRLHINGRDHSTSFKNFYQEQGIPPWMRGRLPLLYADDLLVAVADLSICRPFGIGDRESGLVPVWRKSGSEDGP